MKSDINAKKEIDLIRSFVDKVSQLYQIPALDIISQITTPPDFIDASLFSNEILSPLEVLVKYLRENKFNKFSYIARFLQRNPNTIQTTYKNAQKKYPRHLTIISSVSIGI